MSEEGQVVLYLDGEPLDGTIGEVQETALAVQHDNSYFDDLIEKAKFFSNSTLVPTNYQRKPENCLIALDLAGRMGVPMMFVMQNMKVIQGNPSWSGSSIGAMLRCSGKFEDVEVIFVGEPNRDSWGAYVTAKSTKTGKTLRGATITIAIAKAEGWYGKNGSKWKTMPELMLTYRAYAWFGRQHAPELMMGLQSSDEVEDFVKSEPKMEVVNPYEQR